MTLFTLCFIALGACVPLFLANGASGSGSSLSPSTTIYTPTSITNVSSFQPTTSSIRAPASSSFSAGTASANNQSSLPDPPLRLPGKRRNGLAGFSKSFRNNFQDNIKYVFRTPGNSIQWIRRTTLQVTLLDRQRLHDFLNVHIINPLLDALTPCYNLALDSISAFCSKWQRTSQIWMIASQRWTNTQVAIYAQVVKGRMNSFRDWVSHEMWSSIAVSIWRSDKEVETWWSRWFSIESLGFGSKGTLRLLRHVWCFFKWAYKATNLALMLLLALGGFALILGVLWLALWALVWLKRRCREIRDLWDALLNGE